MLGHSDVIYDWQIVRKTEKSFLVFLFFDTHTAPVKEKQKYPLLGAKEERGD